MYMTLELTKLGEGCSLYINEKVSFKIRKDRKLGESVFIEIDKNVFKYTKNIISGVIYRSPDSQLSLFNSNLENLLFKVDLHFSPVTITSTHRINYSISQLQLMTLLTRFLCFVIISYLPNLLV